MFVRLAVAAALVALLGACASAAPSAPMLDRAALESDGRDIAEAQCAACHAVGPYGDSPNASAPPFRTILTRYSASVLEEELIAGIQVAHPMPEFQFNPQATDALIAYLQSIQQSPPAPTP
jgi:mono/diheme cytochrome c family protein